MGCSSFQKVINGVEGLRLSTAAGRRMNEATMRDRDIHLAIAGKGPAGRGGIECEQQCDKDARAAGCVFKVT